MVGKGDTKSSRIFHQCYVKCCKLQNLTPLNNVIPSANGKVLDFCVDRIKYVEWPPILNALSCDLSLHSLSIRCRQQVKTGPKLDLISTTPLTLVLEQIDCERLAKTVNKRAVVLTKFVLSNLVEAVSQLLSDSTLLSSVLLEGLPLRIPYLNPICEALQNNNSLSHIALPRCLIGDAGCLAICKAVRCLPNILTLDLSGCELTIVGAGYIADLIKYQKIHRYSENWVHTLRYRSPELDAMAGLRRITLCGNPQLGDAGAAALLPVLADDLWIKAVDLQNCELTQQSAQAALQMLQSNTTLVVLDLRHNAEISGEALGRVRAALRKNESGMGEQYSWLSGSMSSGDGVRLVKTIANRTVSKDRPVLNQRNAPMKYASKPVKKGEKDYAEALEEQLQEEISHRQQLEELNVRLVEQMRQLKQQQARLWANNATSSGSEQSLEVSSRSGEQSTSSGSTCSVPIDQHTLSYIQQAFRDIYAFIKNNQCEGNCQNEPAKERQVEQIPEEVEEVIIEEYEESELQLNIVPKKAQSSQKFTEGVKVNKMTKSAHLLGRIQHIREAMQTKPEMVEKQMGDTKHVQNEEYLEDHNELNGCSNKSKKGSASRSSGSPVSDSSDTLVSPHHVRASRHKAKNSRRGSNSREPNLRLPSSSGDASNAREAFSRTSGSLSRSSLASRESVVSRESVASRDSLSPRGLNPMDALYSSSDESS